MTTMISSQPGTAVTVTRAPGREYRLTNEHGRVSAGEGDQPRVRLSRAASVVPGPWAPSIVGRVALILAVSRPGAAS